MRNIQIYLVNRIVKIVSHRFAFSCFRIVSVYRSNICVLHVITMRLPSSRVNIFHQNNTINIFSGNFETLIGRTDVEHRRLTAVKFVNDFHGRFVITNPPLSVSGPSHENIAIWPP